MVDLLYSQYRDYRGHVIERGVTPFARRQRFTVWRDCQRLGVFRDAILAEQFIERCADRLG